MSIWQRFVYWLAIKAGLLPVMPAGLVDRACEVVKAIEVEHKPQNSEYRRHIAMKRLMAGGAKAREAAVAIEIAVHMEM